MNRDTRKYIIINTILKIICYVVLATIFLLGIFYFENYYQNKYVKNNLQNSSKEASPTTAGTTTQKLPEVPTASPEKISNYQVPILMYHYIRDWNRLDDKIGTNLSVSPKEFETQMQWLVNNKYQSVDFNYFLSPYKMDLKPIIITFDDGYSDAYTNAFPILKKYKLIGVFYVITSKVGTPEYLSWDMIKEMQASGMRFGSHTVKHPNLTGASDKTLTDELKTSKEKLEQELKISITDFCYPSGKYEDRTISELKNIGYKTAVTVQNGIANEKSDLFKLPRKRIQNNTNLSSILP